MKKQISKQTKSTRPKAIIFDWDNTLADTWGVIHDSLAKTFIAMGQEPWSMEDVRNGRGGIHKSLRDSFPSIFGKEWQEAKEHYYKNFLSNHLEMITMIPDAHGTVTALSDLGIYLAIVSNKTGKYLRKEVGHLGWDPHFSKIIGATDAASDKPSPEPVYMALEGSGIDIKKSAIDDVWFIGDSATDIECAINAGCLPIYFGDKKFPEEFSNHKSSDKPIKHVKTHKELQKFIKGHFSEE